MAKLNFPDPSESPWLAPTGVVYTFIGSGINGYWSGTELDASTSIEAVFVEVAGDDMTGNLTLGTNKIKLDAATGAGTFADRVDTRGGFTVDGGTSLSSGIYYRNDAGDKGLRLYSGSTVDADKTVEILTSGTATFASEVVAGVRDVDCVLMTSAGTTQGVSGGVSRYALNGADGSASFAGGASVVGGSEIRVGSGGAAFAVQDNSGTGIYAGSAINLRNTSNDITVDIKSTDGSAEFKSFVISGSVEAGGGGGNYLSSGEVAAYAPNGTSPVFRGWNAGTGGANALGVSILASGEATFKGNVNVGDTTASTGGTQISAAGYLYLRSAAADKATPVIDVYNLNNIKRASINADGSIETRSSLSAADGYSGINVSGTIYANRSNGADVLFSGATYGGPVTSSITAAGSAEFKGQLQVNGDMRKSTAAGILKLAMLDDSLRLFNTPVTYNDWKINLKTDGSADFKGTVTSNGSVLTRASGDLNVGERLEKADTALKALKTAVATVSDFAALKAALITALADI